MSTYFYNEYMDQRLNDGLSFETRSVAFQQTENIVVHR